MAPTSTRARRPNRRGEGARLREDIVLAAAELVDEAGTAAAVTLSAVARRVGIAAPSIYAHFAGPDAILLAVVQAEFARLRADLSAAVDAARDDAVERLRVACAAYRDAARTRPRRYLLMFGGIWDAGPAMADAGVDRAEVEELGRSSLDLFAALLQACVDEGRSTSDDPAADGIALWVALHGLAHQRIVSTALDWPPDTEERLLVRLARLVVPEPVSPDPARDGPPTLRP